MLFRSHGIKGIFFVVGQEVDRYPGLAQEIHQRGHLLGNHTYSHRNVTALPEEIFLAELTATDDLLKEITGHTPAYFRPPRGVYNIDTELILAKTGHSILMWDMGLERQNIVDSRQAVNNLLKRATWKKNLVILLHDGDPSGRHSREITVDSLTLLIEELIVRNYQFIEPASPSGTAFITAHREARSNQWYRESQAWAGGLVLLAAVPVIALRRKFCRPTAHNAKGKDADVV